MDRFLCRTLRGVGAALATPMLRGGAVDFEALGRLVDYVIDGGVDYLVALGTTAETPTLYLPERAAVVHAIRDRCAGRVPLVVGIGGNSTAEVLDQFREIDLTGATAILSVTPYYNRPSQRGLMAHYGVVAEASPLPVILYNVPSRTGVNLLPETTLELARMYPNVAGVKEASGRTEAFDALLAGRPEGFLVLSGDDALALPLIERGGDGVISVAAVAFPEPFCDAVHAALRGDWAEARARYARVDEAIGALFAEGNPVGLKAALHVKGLVEAVLRLPLVEGSPALHERMRALIGRYNL